MWGGTAQDLRRRDRFVEGHIGYFAPAEQPAQPKLSGIMPVQNVGDHSG